MYKGCLVNKLDSLLLSGDKFSEVLNSFSPSSLTLSISFVNPFSYYTLLKHPVLNSIDMLFSDGLLHTWMHRVLFKDKGFTRASFDYSSVAHDTLLYSQTNQYRVALIGGEADDINRAKQNVLQRYPALNITFHRNGYFVDETDKAMCINDLEQADVIIVGMGTPLQEQFCELIKNTYPVGKLLFTCGGFITQTAIKSDYYHPLIKKLGLRWLQRAYMHKHVRQRLMKEYPLFIFSYIRQHISKR